jgi:hypothetical protein
MNLITKPLVINPRALAKKRKEYSAYDLDELSAR